uniref:Uncharacterized protein n=1 Tax=Brassica oleracea TaxID=3712 RepID=A0A3P6FCR4_BRAOL|nr:unnamed protein product [Brassica oleracea]
MAIRRRSGVQALQTRREGSLMVPRPVMSSGGAISFLVSPEARPHKHNVSNMRES